MAYPVSRGTNKTSGRKDNLAICRDQFDAKLDFLPIDSDTFLTGTCLSRRQNGIRWSLQWTSKKETVHHQL